jgi:hypothetical protein
MGEEKSAADVVAMLEASLMDSGATTEGEQGEPKDAEGVDAKDESPAQAEIGKAEEGEGSQDNAMDEDADPESAGQDDASDTEDGEEPEKAEDPEAEEGADEGKSKEWPKSARKRVGKLTEQKHALEQRVSELEGELQSRGAAQSPEDGGAMAGVDSLAKLQAVHSNFKRYANDLDRYVDDAMTDGEKAEFEKFLSKRGYISEDGEPNMRVIKALRFEVKKTLEDAIPARAEYLKLSEQSNALVTKVYPWWNDKSSAEYNDAQKLADKFPAIKAFPDWKFWIGHMVRGYRASVADQQKKTTKASSQGTKPNPPKLPGAPGNRVPAKGAKEGELEAARKKMMAGGGVEDLIMASLKD